MTDPAASTRLLSALRRTGAVLDERGHPWALVGGLAVSIRVEPRFTRDIDLAVSVPDDESAEALVSALAARGFTLTLSLEQSTLGRLAAVRVLPPGEPEEGIVVDLLFASSGIEPETCRDADQLEVAPGLVVPVAQAGHLVAMKVLAVAPDRPQDGVDLAALVARLTVEDRTRAVEAVAQIERLRANRGRALRSDLDAWLARYPPPG